MAQNVQYCDKKVKTLTTGVSVARARDKTDTDGDGEELDGHHAIEPSCREAGRRGGFATLSRRGREHFSTIGILGQKVFAARFDSVDRSTWGKLGGRPRKTRA